MPPRLGIAFLCSWKQLNSVLATWEVNRNTGWTGACAEQRLHQSRSRRVPSPGVTLLGSRAGSCSSACPCAALSETPLEASGCTFSLFGLFKATVPAETNCFPVAEVPAACFGAGVLSDQWNSHLVPPEMGDVCDCSFGGPS